MAESTAAIAGPPLDAKFSVNVQSIKIDSEYSEICAALP